MRNYSHRVMWIRQKKFVTVNTTCERNEDFRPQNHVRSISDGCTDRGSFSGPTSQRLLERIAGCSEWTMTSLTHVGRTKVTPF